MRWVLLLWGLFNLVVAVPPNQNFEKLSFNRQELIYYKNKVKRLFDTTLENYLQLGYPYDELKPISCVPKKRKFDDPTDTITNDVLGNFTITLIDSLTTVAIMNDKQKFKELVELVRSTFPRGFQINSTVQVFETTIRIIGSLLSSHLYASDERKAVYLGNSYDGFLLELARDMADRLLPAYLTSTGLPVSRINLIHKFKGFTESMIVENNVAAMACPMFEFTILSYLTGDDKYRELSRYAFDKTWSLRSDLDLLPMSFNPKSQQINTPVTGIGASIDSFFEYALKGSVLFDDQELYEVWRNSSRALDINLKADWFYINGNYLNGQIVTNWIDSLSAFFPGLQVLAGNVDDATLKNLMSLKLWNTFGGIPERWNIQNADSTVGMTKMELLENAIPLEWYPLRPEFVESTYFLYRATKDPFYLNIGYNILKDIETRFSYNCGLGGIQDVKTGEPQDRMESFVLSETLKYLYLLFDENNELHNSRDNVVFSTEAHPMWLTANTIRNYMINQYFNDTVYLDHITRLKSKDMNSLLQLIDKGTLLGRGLQWLSNLLFNNDTVDQDQLGIAESNLVAEEISYNNDEYICKISKFMSNNNDGIHILKSKLLSDFDKLFEIDYRYNDTLIKPDYLQGHNPMELNSEFYYKWIGTNTATSRAQQTTESFDITIDLDGDYDITQLSNGNIHCPSFQGRRKIRLEKIIPGCFDSYANFVKSRTFTETNTNDIMNPKCKRESEQYTPAIVYMATIIDGIPLSKDNIITISKPKNATLEGSPSKKNAKDNTFLDIFGYNENNQLMLDCIPIINIFLE